jgi:hypothetical protein
MKNIIFKVALVSFIGLASCSDKNPTPTYTLSSEFKDYFVNHDVRTKWIYKDTSSGLIDTIELISKVGEGWQEEGKNPESGEGYRLEFTSKKNRDFTLNVASSKSGFYSATLNPTPLSNGADAGSVRWGYKPSENRWYDEFKDSLKLKDSIFYDVILSNSSAISYNRCYYSSEGLVAFKDYQLIKVLKL